MSKPTAPTARGPSIRCPEPAVLIAAAAAYGFGELCAGLGLALILSSERAEPDLLLIVRPWLLALAALQIRRWAVRERAGFYLLALLLGTAGAMAVNALWGAPARAPFAALGIGLALACLFDLAVQGPRALWPRRGAVAGGLLLLAALAVPGGAGDLHMRLAGTPEPAPPAKRPPLTMMTGLPIIWGEGGPFDPESRPAASHGALSSAYDLRLVDALDEAALADTRLLLLAQPRALAPEELMVLDAWVRGGGRLALLADPRLVWPTGLPPDDPRRPPPTDRIAPLLDHWGLALAEGPPGIVAATVRQAGADRRLIMAAPGWAEARGADCAGAGPAVLLACRIGAGRLLLVADADFLHDALWTGPGGEASRAWRRADNPWLLVGWLDRLADVSRDPPGGVVRWRAPGARPGLAAMAGLGALALLAIGARSVHLLRRRRSPDLSTGPSSENRSRNL